MTTETEWQPTDLAPMNTTVRILFYYGWGEGTGYRYDVMTTDPPCCRWYRHEDNTIYEDDDVAGWMSMEGDK